MGTQRYVILGNNDDYPTDADVTKKKFGVLLGSFKDTEVKTQTRRRTITGAADTQEGFVVRTFTLSLKCPTQVSDTTYGTLTNLRAFFRKNEATGINSGRLRFWEFDGTVHLVEMVGDLSPDQITPVVDGTDALFFVPITLEKVD